MAEKNEKLSGEEFKYLVEGMLDGICAVLDNFEEEKLSRLSQQDQIRIHMEVVGSLIAVLLTELRRITDNTTEEILDILASMAADRYYAWQAIKDAKKISPSNDNG